MNDLPGDRYMTDYQAGLSDREIARRHGVTHGAVFQWRRRRALPSHTATDRDRYRADYDAGMNDRQIAEKHGVTRVAVSGWRSVRGLPPVTGRGRGRGLGRWVRPGVRVLAVRGVPQVRRQRQAPLAVREGLSCLPPMRRDIAAAALRAPRLAARQRTPHVGP